MSETAAEQSDILTEAPTYYAVAHAETPDGTAEISIDTDSSFSECELTVAELREETLDIIEDGDPFTMDMPYPILRKDVLTEPDTMLDRLAESHENGEALDIGGITPDGTGAGVWFIETGASDFPTRIELMRTDSDGNVVPTPDAESIRVDVTPGELVNTLTESAP